MNPKSVDLAVDAETIDRSATWFAPAARSSAEDIEWRNLLLASSPVLAAALESFPGPAVLLDRNRQIVLANDAFVLLSGRSRAEVLGSRPGEALDCVHSREHPGGCGTGKSCRYCGAVDTILRSQHSEEPVEGFCQLRRALAETGEQALDLDVRCSPIREGGERFTVLAVRDVSGDRRRELLERIFFHDILNVAGGVAALSEVLTLADVDEAEVLRSEIAVLSGRLIQELEAQRDLVAAERGDLQLLVETLDVAALGREIVSAWRMVPQFADRMLEFHCDEPLAALSTDRAILRRVLDNLVKNALEAASGGDRVELRYEAATRTFRVRNPQVMPESVRRRMFHRSFSTKAERGHGVGTWSVHLLTTRYLQGAVAFTSAEGQGTEFRIELPSAVVPDR